MSAYGGEVLSFGRYRGVKRSRKEDGVRAEYIDVCRPMWATQKLKAEYETSLLVYDLGVGSDLDLLGYGCRNTGH